MSNDKFFKTKTGFCHILPDKIILTRDGIIGNVAQTTVGNSLLRILSIYGVISIILFYSAFINYTENRYFLAILFISIALFLMYGIFSSLNNSAAPVIKKEHIEDIKLKRGISGLTRSRFEVLFEDEKGKIKRRLIMLPGSLTGGETETQKAIQIMKEENLLK